MIFGLSDVEKEHIGREGAKKLSPYHRDAAPLYTCDCCGDVFPLHLLDSKPERMVGRGSWYERLFPAVRLRRLCDAMWNNDDFDRMECKKCYGPGWVEGVPENWRSAA